MEKMIVLIPAYNPTENFISLIDELKEKKIEIIVVNDGSNSDEIFNRIKDKCTILNHEVNKGKGCALKTGFKYIKNCYKDVVIVTMDADLQHTVRDAIKVFECALKNKDCFVIGGRKFDKNTPIKSKIGNSITRKVFNKVSGVKIYDTQTGLRGFYVDLIDEMLNISGDRFEYEMNVLLTLTNKKIKIIEVEIETIYFDKHTTTFKAIKDSIKVYKVILAHKKL